MDLLGDEGAKGHIRLTESGEEVAYELCVCDPFLDRVETRLVHSHGRDTALLEIGKDHLDHASILQRVDGIVNDGIVTYRGHLEHAGDGHRATPSHRE